MSDDFNDENRDDEQESFAELLESYSAGMNDDLQVGDKISARIISVGEESIFLDTGTKVDGVVDRVELADEEGRLSLSEGDTVELFVVAVNEHEIRLSQAISGIGGLELLSDAFKNAIPVEGKVSAVCKGGFQVDMLQRRAFCPISQIDVNFVETPDDFVGQTFEFLITRLEERGRNIVVSRRKLLSAAMEKEKAAFLSTLKVGDLFEGRITRLMPYGAFVELIPGLEGMVHISELSWSRLEKPEDAFRPDDKVTVQVIDIADGAKKNQKKIALSVKQVDGDPWDTVAEKFKPGDKVSGKVSRCANFGVFVEIAPGIDGLVHISEMSYIKRVVNPAEIVAIGETVSVLIKEIDLDRKRISLSIRDAEGDPWLEVPDRFRVGRTVTGTIEKKEKFGYFISLAPGITGLLPKSKFSAAESIGSLEQLKPGDSVSVTIDEIRLAERKISLAPGGAKDADNWKNFRQDAAPAPMSDLAEKLRRAISSQK